MEICAKKPTAYGTTNAQARAIGWQLLKVYLVERENVIQLLGKNQQMIWSQERGLEPNHLAQRFYLGLYAIPTSLTYGGSP